LVSAFFGTSRAGPASVVEASTAASVTATAVPVATRVLMLVIVDQGIQDRIVRSPPENREVKGRDTCRRTREADTAYCGTFLANLPAPRAGPRKIRDSIHQRMTDRQDRDRLFDDHFAPR
jgi:hypothetical protein